MIDMKLTYSTRDGRSVRLLCTDGNDSDYPVIGIISGLHSTYSWFADGNFDPNNPDKHPYDLIEVKPKIVVERWFNIFKPTSGDPFVALWPTEAEAIRGSNVTKWKVLARAVPFVWREP